MWKKEYYDLFNQTAKKTINKVAENLNKPKLLSNDLIKKHYDNNINNNYPNINLYKSTPNFDMKKNIKRPQTAQIKSTKSTDFEKACEGIKILYSKNTFQKIWLLMMK